ncbi:hypothetical protein OROHE_019967 [Orobanche hederae]
MVSPTFISIILSNFNYKVSRGIRVTGLLGGLLEGFIYISTKYKLLHYFQNQTDRPGQLVKLENNRFIG